MYANLKLRLKKFYNDHNILDWDALWVWWKLTFFVGLVALACNSGCADKGDDPPNCQSTTGCTDVDGGSDVDADDATPDADIDGNTADVCAQFAQPNPTGLTWDCTGDYNFQCGNPTFVPDSGECYSLCDDGSTAGKVESSDQMSSWHYFTTTMAGGHITCRPL